MLEMQSRLLVVAVRLEDLAEREVLLPGALIARPRLQRAPRQIDGVVQVLQGEKDAGEVEQHLGVVRRHGEGAAEALDCLLRVAFDAPEVADLAVELHRFRLLKRVLQDLSKFYLMELEKIFLIINFRKLFEKAYLFIVFKIAIVPN